MQKLDQALSRLHGYVHEKKLFPAGAKLLICCSGGADSVALLYLFSRLRSLMHVTLLAVHVDHQLRGAESEADAELVKEHCQQLNVPVIVRKVRLESGTDLENQARKKRFEVFQQILELYRFDFIVTGHHNNDQTETMLMNLFRGAGLNGMAGIKPRSGNILHPLLCFNKSELIDLLQHEKISWREDASNQDLSFRRNWVRHTLIPLLAKEVNPAVGEKIGLQAQIFEEAELMVRQKVKPLLRKAALEQSPERVVLSLPVLRRYGRLEQYYVLREALVSIAGTERDFFLHNFEELRGLMDSAGSKYILLNNGVTARKQYDELIIAESQPPREVPEPYSVEEDRSRAVYGEFRFSFKILKVLPAQRHEDRFNVYLDADKISFPFKIRSRSPGDRFMPLGMTQQQKLKDFFINSKVPKFERDHVPIFDDGAKIFWIAGHRPDARAAIEPGTTRFLYISAERVHEKPMRAANRSKRTGETNEPDEL
ncbi:MAG: tRNA lysidine(34) synthetase TilS [Candidatus Syntrophosphaera sp.]|nr:tRNA lysidine(34) synthetase TilS [Candidatus Syntrophosphaera sp.]